MSTRGPPGLPPQGFVRPRFSRAEGRGTRLCPPVRSNLHQEVAMFGEGDVWYLPKQDRLASCDQKTMATKQGAL